MILVRKIEDLGVFFPREGFFSCIFQDVKNLFFKFLKYARKKNTQAHIISKISSFFPIWCRVTAKTWPIFEDTWCFFVFHISSICLDLKGVNQSMVFFWPRPLTWGHFVLMQFWRGTKRTFDSGNLPYSDVPPKDRRFEQNSQTLASVLWGGG